MTSATTELLRQVPTDKVKGEMTVLPFQNFHTHQSPMELSLLHLHVLHFSPLVIHLFQTTGKLSNIKRQHKLGITGICTASPRFLHPTENL